VGTLRGLAAVDCAAQWKTAETQAIARLHGRRFADVVLIETDRHLVGHSDDAYRESNASERMCGPAHDPLAHSYEDSIKVLTRKRNRSGILGHPIHPMLTVLPLGLFIGAVVFDAIYL
jgi:hypothetical protein